MVWLLAAALAAVAAGIGRAQDGQALRGSVTAGPAGTAAPAGAAQQGPPQPAPGATAAAPASGAAPPSSAAPAQPPAANKPGFLQVFANWWTESAALFSTSMKDAQRKLEDFNKTQNNAAKEAMKNAAEATKDAATVIVRLPATRMIEVHERCATAPNGAPDCQETATSACRGKGFASGRPLDVSSSEKCATTMWLSGQSQTPGQCPLETETIVLRAVCQ
ncbi:MAG TPA: hypothetical protein VK430_07140 [Xanthobacteraceae bacterium]|nr:hypothetical protein [Xanthobacteraceae bacterium]